MRSTRSGHDETVSLLPTPDVTIDDAAVEEALRRAVQIINPLLDVLWGTDPLGLKRRRTDADDGPLDKVGGADEERARASVVDGAGDAGRGVIS